VRFASRLGFRIERKTYAAIKTLHDEITKAPAPRVLEEINKLYMFSSAEAAFRLLRHSGLLKDCFPELDEMISARKDKGAMLWACLGVLDSDSASLDPPLSIKFAMLLYAPFLWNLEARRARGEKEDAAAAAHDVINPFSTRFCVPKRVVYEVVAILSAYPRLHDTTRRFSKTRFVVQPSFLHSFLAYRMAARAGAIEEPRLGYWEDLFAEHVPDRRMSLSSLMDAPSSPRPKRKRAGRGRRRRPAQGAAKPAEGAKPAEAGE
jgi:tRNA nucleotidyltransferase/poly(A) polymerase